MNLFNAYDRALTTLSTADFCSQVLDGETPDGLMLVREIEHWKERVRKYTLIIHRDNLQLSVGQALSWIPHFSNLQAGERFVLDSRGMFMARAG
jgi:hypothetical protein